jgi:hypothetical protein
MILGSFQTMANVRKVPIIAFERVDQQKWHDCIEKHRHLF